MKTINFNEIYYTSSERSILTNYAGIGVRTYTESMDTGDVSAIASKCVFGYSVDEGRRLTYEQIQQNPKIVYDYLPTYVYQKVTLDNGSVKYVVGRTVYLGIDYGYFCGRNSAIRTGTNYFTHLLVFDEFPPAEVMSHMTSGKLFVPADYTCEPSNSELQQLLTGEPKLLPRRTIRCSANESNNVTPEMAWCIVALLQSYFNAKNNKEEGLTKIIIQAPEAVTASIVGGMAMLPAELVMSKTFLTNYIQGYGVPDGFGMAFVNEHNKKELYVNNHISVNLFTKSSTNIDDNFIYKKIIELSEECDGSTILKLVDYFLRLDLTKENDYQFLYNLFVVTETDKPLLLQDITKEFIDHAGTIRLSAQQNQALWRKINDAVNAGLMSEESREVFGAISVLGYVLGDKNLEISRDSIARMTNVIFGKKPFLGRIVKASNVDIMRFILDRNLVSSPTDFFNALRQSNDSMVWLKLLSFYYADGIDANLNTIVEEIQSSEIGRDERIDMINKLFPVKKYKKELFSYILNHIGQIPEMTEIVREICLSAREECFSIILQRCGNDQRIIDAISPIVFTYFENIVTKNPGAGAEELLLFNERVSADVFNLMGILDLFGKFADTVIDNPSKNVYETIRNILSSGVPLDGDTFRRLTTIRDLFEDVVPSKVDVKVLLAAHKMDKKTDYIARLHESWLKTAPKSKELKEYVKGVGRFNTYVIESLILSIWKSSIGQVKDNRKEYVLIVADNAKWESRDKKNFLKSCKEKDLVHHLMDSDSLFSKLIRNFLNLFKS